MHCKPTVITASLTNSQPQQQEEHKAQDYGGKAKEGKRRKSRLKSQSSDRKKNVITNRVPDETLNMEDTVCNLNTSYVLALIGLFKLFLLVPLLVLGIILISLKSSTSPEEARLFSKLEEVFDSKSDTTPSIALVSTMDTSQSTITANTRINTLGNDSIAPVWTAIMLAASAATDFIAVWKRRGSTIVIYMLIATVAFVACILCIEYDRIEITNIAKIESKDVHLLDLHFRLYLSCVIVASIGVATGILSIYVGTRMAALEQHRLYMERDGLEAVLNKKVTVIPSPMLWIRKKLRCIQTPDSMTSSLDCDVDSLTIHNESINDSDHRHETWSEKSRPTSAIEKGGKANNVKNV